ncbi:unknown [Acidaminococcus intestini CAG:325]|nr:unknown [Acidaminococcus intestini CAG:325]
MKHGLTDSKNRRVPAFRQGVDGSRRLHEMIERFAHGPIKQTAANTAADGNGVPLPGRKVRFGINSANLDITPFEDDEDHPQNDGKDSKEVDPPAKVISYEVEHL